MRPRNPATRERITSLLRQRAAVSATELANAVGVSVPTLHRVLSEFEQNVIATGKARRSRYGLQRPLRGAIRSFPLYAVDEKGRGTFLSTLRLAYPSGSHLVFADAIWPTPDFARDGWWEGLPYPFCDMRPQGFVGRQFARAQHEHFQVPSNPDQWSDDDVVHVLSNSAWDTSGNLVLGDTAIELWQQRKLSVEAPLTARVLGQRYTEFAQEAIGSSVPASSTAGEFPKFGARRELAGSATSHVIVKFSGRGNAEGIRRWSDLLVCEHLAHCSMQLLPNVQSARSRIVLHGGRTFLEVERFDRHGDFGRSGLISLSTIDGAFVGSGSMDWTRVAQRLEMMHLIDLDDRVRIELLWWFGRLIANSDMHAGNLSFVPRGRFVLAPAYDMLPMLYAPLAGGEVPTREFSPAVAAPERLPLWKFAVRAALEFWRLAANDSRISSAFRAECMRNWRKLDQVAARV